MITENFDVLKAYVPESSLSILQKWFFQRPFQLKISKKRSTKFGDFRAPRNKSGISIISVNDNLNPYAFLITLTHEFAHHMIWLKHQNKVQAHGLEWKNEFAKLVSVLLEKNIFPSDIQVALQHHIKNPSASSARDQALVKALRKFDPPSSLVHLSDLELGAHFSLNGKRVFIKGEKKRTRYLCNELNSRKTYLINGIAEVQKISVK